MSATPTQNYWQTAITSVMRRVNGAAWFERFAPGMFASATVAALGFYALRRIREASVEWGWMLLAVGLLIAAIVAWRLARRGFFSHDDARSYLEYHMRLDSRLSAAEAGAGAWPDVTRSAENGKILRWKASAAACWFAGAFAMLAAGLWLPVPASSEVHVAPVEKPPALAQTEEWLKNLTQVNAVDPQTLENLAAQARELSSKPTETQYTHSALEAADSLRSQTEQAMKNLANDFDTAAAALSTMQRYAASQNAENAHMQQLPNGQQGASGMQGSESGMSEEQMKRTGEQLEKALRGMREGTLAANSQLSGALGKLDPSTMRQMSAEQAAALAGKMAGAAREMRGAMGKPPPGVDGDTSVIAGDKLDALLAAIDNPNAPTRNAPGNGGVDRGRGDAPLSFEKRTSDAGSGTMEAVHNDDYASAALGDKLGIQIGEHTIDRSKAVGSMSAGAVAGNASGGDAVWVNKLTPAERETLKEFFK